MSYDATSSSGSGGQVKPTFVTGARAKIKIDGTTLAFATNVTYNMEVAHIPVECLGAYEVMANEPVSYRVSGTLSIVRYTKSANALSAASANDNGNSTFKLGSEAGLQAAFNPANLLLSTTFDIDIFDRRDGNPKNDGIQFLKVHQARLSRRSGGVAARGLNEETWEYVGVMISDDQATVSPSGPNEGSA